MKKIISILICIAVLFAVCVLSAFAYERTDELSLETIELSEREQRTEENNVFRSVDSVSLNTKYNYTSNIESVFSSFDNHSDYSGRYIGEAKVNGEITNVNIEFTSIYNHDAYSVILYDNYGQNIIKDNTNIYNGIIIFYTYGNFTRLNTYFQATLTEDPMNNVYDNSGDFLGFITDTLTDLVDYMVTNNLILIVMAIVIVSFGIGVLIRITKVK